jgi:hypothetical protein
MHKHLDKIKPTFDNFLSSSNKCNTIKYHQRRFNNPFVIIGMFYPPKDLQANQKFFFNSASFPCQKETNHSQARN